MIVLTKNQLIMWSEPKSIWKNSKTDVEIEFPNIPKQIYLILKIKSDSY